MKKRVLSALLVLCMACSMVSTVWANQATPETATPETAATASPAPSPTPDVSAYPARTAEQTIEDAGVTVKVDVPAGSLPADAQLTAEMIGSSADDAADQAVTDVAEELAAANVDYDGFVALDISFVGADGAKTEPLQPVSVSFSMPADLLPAEADPATLAVQHLAEDADGEVETVETVADVADETDGTVTVEIGAAALSLEEDAAALPADAEVKAEFEVDGFSSFVITWQGEGTLGGIINYKLNTLCVNEAGQEIGTVDFQKVFTWNLVGGSNVLYTKDIAPVFKGYDYHHAEITDDGQTYEVEYVSVNRNALDKEYYAYYNGEEHEVGNNQIRFVYKKDETGSGEPGVPSTLAHEKYVTANDDGTYKLGLNVVGSVGSEESKAEVDVVYVLDMSSSMDYGLNGDTDAAISKKRIRLASEAIRTMSESLTLNDKIDARFALAKFGTRSMDSMDWTDEPTVLLNSLPIDAGYNEGTNYEAGLNSAKSLLENGAREGAIKIVVFISDGDPTHYGNGSRDDSGAIPIEKAKDVVETMTDIDHFYAVGVGPSSGYNRLGELLGAVAEGVETKPVFEGKDEASLSQAFADIESAITYISCTNVQITDVLSDNVVVEMDATGAPKLDITVRDANGTEVSSDPTYGNGKIQVEFTAPVIKDDGTTENKNFTVTARTEENADGKTQIVLDFPEEYQLNQNWSYTVTATVSATQAAYDAYAKNGYTDKGEAGTGTTSEGKDGLFSNEHATLTYQVNGETKNEPYAKPVIQLTPNTLTIEKTFEGLTEEQINALTDLSFTVTLTNDEFTTEDGITTEDGKRTQTVTFTTTGDDVFTKKDETSLTYIYSIPGISPNTGYSVKEVGGALEGYEVEATPGDTASGTFSANGNETKTASFTNTYTEKPKVASLTITKKIDGASAGGEYTFKVEQTGNGWTDGKLQNNAVDTNGDGEVNEHDANFGTNGTATVTVNVTNGEGNLILNNLPLGEYTITEQNGTGDITVGTAKYYWTETEYKVGETESNDDYARVNLSEPETVTVTNSYEPYKSLTITKTIDGEMASSTEPFSFTACKTNEGGSLLVTDLIANEKAKIGELDSVGKVTFTMQSGGQVTIINLKNSDVVEIQEDASVEAQGYDVTVTVPKDTNMEDCVGFETYTDNRRKVTVDVDQVVLKDGITDLGTINYKNYRAPVAPTGLESNHTTPYVLMITAAGMAGLALIGGIVARRIRRRREE